MQTNMRRGERSAGRCDDVMSVTYEFVLTPACPGVLNDGSDHPADHVRRSGDAAVAEFARGPAEAVPAAVRSALDLSGHHPACVRSWPVCAADRHHQRAISVPGRRAARRDQRRGRHPARAGAARFRAGHRRRRGIRAAARQGRDAARARGRPRGQGHSRLSSPPAATRSRRRPTGGSSLSACGQISPRPNMGTSVRARRSTTTSSSVDKFVEKPNEETAHRYVADGYLWNSGNFMFRADLLLSEYRTFQPDSAAAIEESVERSTTDLGFVLLDGAAFGRAKAISVDYAIMEKTAHAAVLPVSFDWSDVGSWQAVWKLAPKDAADNAVQGKAMFLDAKGSYVSSDKALVDGARCRQPDRDRERGRSPGCKPRSHRRPAAARGATQVGGAERDPGAPQGASAVGLLSVARSAATAIRSSASS